MWLYFTFFFISGTQNDADGNEEEDLAQSEQEGEASEPEDDQPESGRAGTKFYFLLHM